jgi:hypothetical protein
VPIRYGHRQNKSACTLKRAISNALPPPARPDKRLKAKCTRVDRDLPLGIAALPANAVGCAGPYNGAARAVVSKDIDGRHQRQIADRFRSALNRCCHTMISAPAAGDNRDGL